jgi:3-methyladenine DNA glycosylase AlkD
MANLQKIAKRLGRDHDLAAALWGTGVYEARMLACLVDDPAQVTPGQMDAWRADFDNWGIVDTVCFKLFDQSPHAFAKIGEWAGLNDEFGKRRAAFALLACLALHDKTADDQPFLDGLVLIERAAGDDRNFVKKAVNWALRAIGLRKSPALKAAALETARRLAASPEPRRAGSARTRCGP